MQKPLQIWIALRLFAVEFAEVITSFRTLFVRNVSCIVHYVLNQFRWMCKASLRVMNFSTVIDKRIEEIRFQVNARSVCVSVFAATCGFAIASVFFWQDKGYFSVMLFRSLCRESS